MKLNDAALVTSYYKAKYDTITKLEFPVNLVNDKVKLLNYLNAKKELTEEELVLKAALNIFLNPTDYDKSLKEYEMSLRLISKFLI